MRWLKPKSSDAKKLSIDPPAPRAGRHGIAIAACVKNEALYIKEWIRFHQAVGIRHFYIYDNGSSDETCALLRGLLSEEELTIVPWAGRMRDAATGTMLNGQVITFAHAILNFGGDYRWMAFIDVDEFLLPRHGRTLEDALKAVADFPNVSLPWHMFATSGHDVPPDGPLTLNYTLRGADPMTSKENVSNFKCIVDPCEVTEVSVHQFQTRAHGDLTANDAGKRFSRRGRKAPEFYSNQFLQLNHYYTKSRQELMAKLDRGWVYDSSATKYREKVLSVVKSIEEDLVEDRSMIDFIEHNHIDLGS
ncbi:glycosyltransferase family 92 protein [Rhizobium sp. P38BS-XIX]|uniref:glycosyltransferase family 92 protein n=1 Tax=Rhizobium sp. P38BS-XIX TaxID=2726740 RepID=UPI001456E8CE|nr:glycosyltransferase family 92 protein [Rhizobium sp. P38BS-XIX]NLR96684.1 glycosyltransferase family 92 protein [Rhizobium sp. P38BS-XIX]